MRVPMGSKLNVALSEFSKGQWAAEPPLHPTELDELQSTRSESAGRRRFFAIARFVLTFCVGVAAVMAWQSYGDAAKGTIAHAFPQLAWLAPQPAVVTPAASARASPDQLKAISHSLTVVRQSVDKLAAELARLQATKPETVDRTSAPPPTAAGTPVRKPSPPSAVRPATAGSGRPDP